MDYLLFCQGFLCLCAAVLFLSISRTLGKTLPISALALFGIFAAIYAWLLLSSAILPNNISLRAFLEFYAAASAVSIFEAGRWMLCKKASPLRCAAIYLIPSLASLTLLVLLPRASFSQAVGFAFGMPGAFLAGWILVRKLASVHGRMRSGLALLAGSLISVAAFYAANNGSLSVSPLSAFLDRAQLFAGIAATLVALGFCSAAWILHTGIVAEESPLESTRKIQGTISRIFVSLIFGALVVGAFLTHYIGRQEHNFHRSSLLFHANLLSQDVPSHLVEALSGTEADSSLPEFQTLREKFAKFRQMLPHARFVYLADRRPDGRVIFLVDSESEGTDGYSPPGSHYPEADDDPDWEQVFAGTPWVGGPDSDSFGIWMSSMVPVHLSSRGTNAVFGVDVSAATWLRSVSRARLAGIAITGLVLSFFVGGFITLLIRQRTQRNLDITRQHFDLALEGAGMASWELDLRTGSLAFDVRWSELTARPAPPPNSVEEFLEILQEPHRSNAQKAIEDYLAGKSPQIDVEIPFLNDADSSPRWMLWKGGASAFLGNHAILVSGTLQSISDRKRLELEISEARKKLERVVESVSEVIFETDIHGAWTFLNPAWKELTGYDPAECLGKPLIDFLHPDDRQREAGQFKTLAALQQPELTTKVRFLRKDGTQRVVRVLGRVVTDDASNSKARIVGTLRDITASFRNQKILESIVLLNSLLITARLDESGWNKALEILGDACDARRLSVYRISTSSPLPEFHIAATWHNNPLSATEPPIPPSDVFHPEDVSDLRQGRIVSVTRHAPDGAPLPDGSVIAAAVFCGSGFWGALVIEEENAAHLGQKDTLALLRSATAAMGLCLSRQRNEDALHRAMQEAREMADEAVQANQAKSTFLATMSHEIRTPLNAVIGMTSLLQESPLDKQQTEYTETILRAGNSLLELINDILDYSKIECGRVDLHEEQFDLYETLLAAIDIAYAASQHKDISLGYHVPPGFPRHVVGDGMRVRQTLLNLVSNAVKFTESGYIRILAHTDPPSNGTFLVHFAVEDTGIGMEPDVLDRLFFPFLQADSSITRKYGGSGLGLAICRRLIELMGGQISVRSEPGKGTRFDFFIPFKTSPTPDFVETPPEIRDVLAGRSILIASATPDRANLLRDHLAADGAATHIALSTDSFIEEISRQPPPDITIVDAKLLAQLSRAHWKRLRSIRSSTGLRIVVLRKNSPASLPPDPEFDPETFILPLRFPQFQAFLAAPLLPHPVLSLQRSALANADGHPTALRVLVAEDNPNNKAVLRMMLTKLGCDFHIVDNGRLALDAANASPFDAIILDLQMPVMDGLTAVAELHKKFGSEHPQNSRPFLLALTANAFQEDKDACLAAGFDEYLAKPITISQLAKALASARKHP